jgi:hypothetical protein
MNDEILQELKYNGGLMEQVLSEVKAMHELVAAQPTLTDFHRLEDDVAELKRGTKVVETAVKATNSDVADLRRDIVEHKSLSAHVAHGHA